MGSVGDAQDEDDLGNSRWHDHLDWTSKQGRILTDNGNALQYYSESNGFPFVSTELPHYYLEQSLTHSVFRKWAMERRAINIKEGKDDTASKYEKSSILSPPSPIIGAWDRPLFAGKWEHSTNNDEIVYNVQTGTLFVDLRIPRSKPVKEWEKLGHRRQRSESARRMLESMGDTQLRLFARQHVFGGYSHLSVENGRLLCTRHHCIDWNYTGKPRPRPNKWYIEGNDTDGPHSLWKEWSYSTDENGQCYYYENWQRRRNDDNGEGLCLAMRRKGTEPDGILVVVGDHFNYILGRQWNGQEKVFPNANSIVELIDSSINSGERETAISYLTLDGGHGTVSSGWKIDCSIQPWNHGSNVFELIGGGGEVRVVGDGNDSFTWEVSIGDSVWQVYESTIRSASELEQLLTQRKRISRL